MKLTQNQFYGKAEDLPVLPKGSMYMAVDTGEIYIYGSQGEPIAASGGVSSYNDLTDRPVIFSGSFNDLTDKPILSPSDVSISQQKINFSALEDGSTIGDLAYVEESEGTNWLPFTLGGTYYPKGLYMWDGTDWVSDRNGLANQIELNKQNIFSGSYNDLTNSPEIGRMNYNEVNNTETVAYLNVMGQSNADGTQEYPVEEQMGEADRLANVYHLGRASAVLSNGNTGEWTEQSTWAWTNFIATEDNNLCRRAVGFYKNGTTEFAKKWQARIDGGEDLPDLYITHMSYSGNGFYNDVVDSNKSRFNPFEFYQDSRENIWHSSLLVHQWALDNLLSNNAGVTHLGILYNQWEHDSQDSSAALQHRSWVQALLLEHDKVTGIKTPLTYYVPSTDGVDGRFAGFEVCKAGFESINDRNTIAINPRELAAYDTSINTINGYNGIYHDDVHYNLESHSLLAEQMFTKGMYNGILITSTTITDLTTYSTSAQVTAEINRAAPKTLWNANEYVSDAAAEIDLAGVTQYRSGTDRKEFRAVKESDGKKYFRMNNRGTQFFFAFFDGLPSDTLYGYLDTSFQAGSRISIGASVGVSEVAEGVATYKDTGRNMVCMMLGCDSANGRANSSEYAFTIWNFKNNAANIGEVKVSNVGLPMGQGTSGALQDVDIRFESAAGSTATTMTFRCYYKLTTSSTYTLLAEIVDQDVSNVESNVLDGGAMAIVSGLGDLGTTALADSMRFKSFKLTSNE